MAWRTNSIKKRWITEFPGRSSCGSFASFPIMGFLISGKDLGDYSALMQPQLVSVFDLSGSQNVIINNILISDILRGLFQKKVSSKEQLPPTLVVIEEAHTFVSKDNVKRMAETLDVLRDINH